jgi:hypothetical protein
MEDNLAFLEENERVASEQVKAALAARHEAQTRLDRANQAHHAWRVLAQQEHERLGAVNGVVGRISPVNSLAEMVAAPERLNKTEYVRTILKNVAGADGITAADILRISRRENPRIIGMNYPYGQLSKLKASGEVVLVTFDGEERYVLVKFFQKTQAAPE